ncbi:MAG: AlbA family DNA-binding domain-containing protein [Planctomycetota bacterium]|jgi:hypothetical protein
MIEEPERSQQMSVYDGSEEQRLRLVRTVAAMANTRGGTVRIERVAGRRGELDGPHVTELVSRYIEPRLKGIESASWTDGSVVVHVPESDSKPHVFIRNGCRPGGEAGPAPPLFWAGQIWVRRGSEDRAGSGDDIQRIVREAASHFLERLSIGIRDPSFSLKLTDAAGISVRLAEDEEAVPVSPNLARLYPYTAKTLAGELRRPTNWVATAVKVLRLKTDRENAYGVPSPSGRIIQWRYSERALGTLRDRLAEDPEWNPYHGQ